MYKYFFSGCLLFSAAAHAEPLDLDKLHDALGMYASAGQVGPTPDNSAAKEAKAAEAKLRKLLKLNKVVELPAGCKFSYAKLAEGLGLETTCDELQNDFTLYIVPGDKKIMQKLRECKSNCTGSFALANNSKKGSAKGTYQIGPMARSLLIWLRPISIEQAP
jgi:hypothetical protein